MFYTKRRFTDVPAAAINRCLVEGNFAILSPISPYMKNGEGWVVADHPHNYARRKALLAEIFGRGGGFTPAIDVRPDADPYSLLLLGLTITDAIEVATKVGISHVLTGSSGGGCFLCDVKRPFLAIEGFALNARVGPIVSHEGEIKTFGENPNFYYDLDNTVLGWAGSVGHHSMGDMVGLINADLKDGKLEGSGKSFEASWLRTLIRV